MSIFGFPLILFQLPAAGAFRELSDIEYLAIKFFEGKRVDKRTVTTGVTTDSPQDAATQTAAAGKDMYVTKATFRIQRTAISGTFTYIIKLLVNGVVVDEVDRSLSTVGVDTSGELQANSEKVGPAQIIKITIEKDSGGATDTYTGKLTLWEEDTNTTPQEPPLNPV